MSAPASVSFPALGGTAVVAVTDPHALAAAHAAVEEEIHAIDLACSRFREDSELSAINAACGQAVTVSPLMLHAVEAALRAARLTGGDVDPTVGGALLSLGYDRDFDEVGDRTVATRPLASVPGWRTVRVDRDASTVRVAAGVVLDLGAVAKALAADRAAAAAAVASRIGVVVSLSGDLAIAGTAPDDGWRVRVTDDHRADASAPGQTITLRAGGLATSSTTVRRWQTESGPVHHLVDPATGRSTSGAWRTVSVAAASCLDANIASTAAVVRGGPALEWLEWLELPSRLVGADGTVRHVAGWPREGDDLPAHGELAAQPAR
jgi:thiamine biosynthesis lipoprotein